MKKPLSFVLSAAILAMTGCNSFLDMTPTDRVSEKTIWAKTETAEYSINYLYTYILDFFTSPTGLGLSEALTDELKYTSYNYNALCFIPSEFSYGGSTLTVNYVDTYLGRWGTLYTAIRRANADLNYLYAYGQMPGADRDRLEGELRFLRGYFYFELLKRYKNVILYDRDLGAITKDKAVSDEEDGWNMVQDDLDFAASTLPEAAGARGRLNKGMALALKSRAMLYARRYEAVIDATDELGKLGYRLEGNYKDAITKTLAQGNVETILQYTFDHPSGITHSFNFYYTPGGDYTVNSATGGGYGVPTQEMVESYEYAGGGLPDWSPWHTTEGTRVTPPYAELEPRFHATILYNGAPWKGRVIEPYVGGTDGWATWRSDKEPKGKTVTGYYLRKLVDEDYDVNTSGSSQPFIVFRYAEALLNKAEACFRTGDETGANAIVRSIRGRVGLPYANLSGEALWAAICRERKVELAYEGLRYWDLRRWGVADKAWPEGLSDYRQHGLKIEKSGSDFIYTYVSVDDKDRSFPVRMYRLPLPGSELNSNALVSQYPEWN